MSEAKIIKEVIVTDATLTSNVPITEIEWVAGSYSDGDQRYVDTVLYESTVDSNTSNPVTEAAKTDAEAESSPRQWVKIGHINRWRMFSQSIGDKTTLTSPVTVVIDVPPSTNAIALFGVQGANYATITTRRGGVVVSTQNIPFTNSSDITNLWRFLYLARERAEDAVALDLPGYGTDQVEISIYGAGEVAVGRLFVGEQISLGTTLLGVGAGIEDWSHKVRDDFGNMEIVERGFSKTVDLQIMVRSGRVPIVMRHLADVRAKAAAYIGSPTHPETIVMGYFTAAHTLRQTTEWVELSLEIEGLDQI